MSRLPVGSGAEAVRAFRRLGYEVDQQTGSHIILRHRAAGRGLAEAAAAEMAQAGGVRTGHR